MKIKYMYIHIDQITLLKRWQKSIYHRSGLFKWVPENKRDTVSNPIFRELFKIVFNCFHVRSITNIFTKRYVIFITSTAYSMHNISLTGVPYFIAVFTRWLNLRKASTTTSKIAVRVSHWLVTLFTRCGLFISVMITRDMIAPYGIYADNNKDCQQYLHHKLVLRYDCNFW